MITMSRAKRMAWLVSISALGLCLASLINQSRAGKYYCSDPDPHAFWSVDLDPHAFWSVDLDPHAFWSVDLDPHSFWSVDLDPDPEV